MKWDNGEVNYGNRIFFLKNLEICSRIFMYERVIESDKQT